MIQSIEGEHVKITRSNEFGDVTLTIKGEDKEIEGHVFIELIQIILAISGDNE